MHVIPNLSGPKVYLDDPAFVDFTGAELALIDSSDASATVYPYAYTATVAEDFDETNCSLLNVNIAANQKVAFGVFLTSDDEKGNLMFEISGAVAGTMSPSIVTYAIFGRCNASTVTSTKAGTANQLSTYTLLPGRRQYGNTESEFSFQQQVFAYNSNSTNPFCAPIVTGKKV